MPLLPHGAPSVATLVVCAAVAAACGPGKPGGADGPEGRDGVRGGDGLFAPVVLPGSGQVPVPAPAPSGCRAVTFRVIPAAPIPPVGTVAGEDTRVHSAARGFVVVRSGVGPARAVAWDAATNRWLDAGPGPETYRRGDIGPVSGGRFMPVGPDHVLLLWRNDSQRPGLQAALADVAAGSFAPISLAGGPGHVGVDGFDTRGRLVVFDSRSLGGGWRFDPRARVWAAVTGDGRPAATGVPTVLALGDRVLAFGAGASGAGAVGALYDPEADAWTAIAAGPTPDAAFVTATDDAVFWWSQDAPHGAVYERLPDRWRDVASAGAPLARPASGLRLFAFTGSHVVRAEQHPENHGLPHDPAAVYALDAGSWRRVPIPPTYGDPFALPDGRVVLFGRGSPQPIVVDPRSGLVCTPDVSAVPTLGKTAAQRYAFADVVGDELVLWGRADGGDAGPACPPGAPCLPVTSWSSSRDDGVAVRF